MMHLGCGRPFKPYVDNCKNGTSPHKAGGAEGAGADEDGEGDDQSDSGSEDARSVLCCAHK